MIHFHRILPQNICLATFLLIFLDPRSHVNGQDSFAPIQNHFAPYDIEDGQSVFSGSYIVADNSSFEFTSATQTTEIVGGASGSLHARQACASGYVSCAKYGYNHCCGVLYNCVAEGCCSIPSNAYCTGYGCYLGEYNQCCPGGSYICDKQGTCIGNQKCCFAGWIQCGTECFNPSSNFCCGGSVVCFNEQVCCGNKCCMSGQVCGAGNTCTYPSTSKTSATTTATSAAAAQTTTAAGAATGSASTERLQRGVWWLLLSGWAAAWNL